MFQCIYQKKAGFSLLWSRKNFSTNFYLSGSVSTGTGVQLINIYRDVSLGAVLTMNNGPVAQDQ